MRSGRHFAQLTMLEGDDMLCRVIQADWDVEGGPYAYNGGGHCFFATFANGNRFPGGYDWEGGQGAEDGGDRIGMLLDLDQGSMPIWKNDVKLGVMAAEGLSGPLCWVAELHDEDEFVRIESALIPAELLA